MIISVTCPSCSTSFPVDPAKIPEGGVNARCSSCATVFFVEKPEQFAVPEAAEPTPDEVTVPSEMGDGPAEERSTPAFETAAPEEVEPTPTEHVSGEVEPAPMEYGSEEVEPAPDEYGSEDWVIEPEPTMSPTDEAPVEPAEPLDTVKGSQDAAHFEEAGGDIDTTEIPSPKPEERAEAGRGESAETPSEPHVTGGFEGGDFADGGFGDGGSGDGRFGGGTDTTEAPPPDMAPPETPAAPDVDEPSTVFEMGPAGTDAPDVGAATEPSHEIRPSEDREEEEEPETGRAPETLPEPEEKPQGFQFGKRDPHEKARRLARVLVSDMIMYNPERHSKALEQGSLQTDFEDEIKKSWSEFVDQVGGEIAHNSSYFTDALNDILAKGEQIFHGQPGS